ncbi:ornithine decarboxylase 2-like [Odontomachus brunneus]|uniref:ornithine decarboxylase 2-like n=1 Tax=Odontomachus brunneus TaxID=486640 RepID=UPI0013F1EF91|nr:ornithine decarboxylase 2-like [Odontomachus brunneus]XP_032673438.1 ornithine decarboxylase 2-like [Odontomachus brunneus]XP_032673512.1 ornithine decarboxylase 2-like [Odontomachus brunneus]XP_032673595.1 ornithine decarboxylase 2-like [Odontomachus brunneus]XP_032673687.1 ornithine decarboxylase 2-like [Odontomachus brunneus]
MARSDFNEIKVIDDTMDDMEIIRNIINTEYQDKPFYIADIGSVIKRHDEWIAKMPRVIPHFALKCNPDLTVIKVLAALGACFDCASEQEIKLVMQHGVHGDRIIFAHPTKYPSHIAYAKKVGVKQMTVDSEAELFKIKDIFPDAKIVIRIRCDAKVTQVVLGLKFGCEPNDEAVHLIRLTKDLGLNLYGFSFHVGSPCGELEAYSRGIAICKQLIATSQSIGCENVQLIDIGGGFPGETETDVDEFASIINEAIQDLDPTIRVISEPGSYYVTSSFTLTTYLHSKRVILRDGERMRMYYINCGVFHSFVEELLGLKERIPQLLFEPLDDEKFCSSLWGPTADSYDLIMKDVLLPELHIGDWLIWKDMGAYSIALATTFNGYRAPIVIPIIRKSEWKNFKKRITVEEPFCSMEIRQVVRINGKAEEGCST